MPTILTPNHFFLTSSSELRPIIQPLQDFFGLTSFVYQKNLSDASEIRLSNQPEWIEFFFQHKLYQQSLFEQAGTQLPKNHYLWADLPKHRPIIDKAKQFNISHGITFVRPAENGTDFYFLGTTPENASASLRVLNNLDLIEKFFIYFQNTAAPLIKRALEHRIVIPDKIITNQPIISSISINRAQFLTSIGNQKLPNFTPRELQCIRLLSSGYTMKMIAQQLQLSPRTIETHFEHIKNKANCRTKAQLLHFINSHNFNF